MITITAKGDLKKVDNWLQNLLTYPKLDRLDRFGMEGVEALSLATPVDTGLTASLWRYEIEKGDGYVSITWINDNEVDGWFNVAVMLQYGHGTRNGGYVIGRDYINPAIQPVFDKIADVAWAEVTKY